MKLRIATFNVENLFSRPKAMNNPTWKEGQPYLDTAAKLNALFNQETYSAADKKKMLALLADTGLLARIGIRRRTIIVFGRTWWCRKDLR